MKCINSVTLLGSMGKDPEHRQTNSGKTVTSFSLATSSSYQDKNGAWQEETQWHNIVAWSLSDYVKEQLGKGVRLLVEGTIKNRSYENKEGKKVYVSEIFASNIIPLIKGEKKETVELVETEEVKDSEDLPF